MQIQPSLNESDLSAVGGLRTADRLSFLFHRCSRLLKPLLAELLTNKEIKVATLAQTDKWDLGVFV